MKRIFSLRHTNFAGMHAAFLCLSLALVRFANAGALSFTAAVDRGANAFSIETLDRSGVEYVSVKELADELGAGCTIEATRVQVDFRGMSAWIRIGDKEVNASLSKFSLARPVIKEGDDVYVAGEDVRFFFSSAFRVAVEPQPEEDASRRPQRTDVSTPAIPIDESPLLQEIAVPEARPVKTIVLDAGHGGSDTGVVGQTTKEKDIVLVLVEKIRRALEAASFQVVLLRKEDRDVSVGERIRLVNASNGDLVLSIHAGASASASTSGCVVLYSRAEAAIVAGADRTGRGAQRSITVERSRQAAHAIAQALAAETEMPVRSIIEAPLKLFASAPIPGVLVEVGCLTNAGEENVLESDTFQDKLAAAIVKGVKDYSATASRGEDKAL